MFVAGAEAAGEIKDGVVIDQRQGFQKGFQFGKAGLNLGRGRLMGTDADQVE